MLENEGTKDVGQKEVEETRLMTQSERPLGFEDEDPGDVIIPRIKVVQTLSPERKDKLCEEGDIINSLTKEKVNGKIFVPVFKFNNNIEWRDRASGGGILCQARDGKSGQDSTGKVIICASCKRCEFDNTKQGKEAAPKCTKYINFFGFFAGEHTPIILSFARTNYAEGKKLYSLAKVTMQNMWNHGYTISEKLVSKNNNEWYNIFVAGNGATKEADREFAAGLYKIFRNMELKYDMEEADTSTEQAPPVDPNTTEF